MLLGFLTGLAYLIAILYSINDLGALATSPFPLAEIYHQATGSRSGTVGLLICIFFPILCCVIGVYITCGRTLWTLARDKATPFPAFISHVDSKHRNPFNATLICGCVVTALGCIYVGSSTAFNALVGSFVIMSTSSYTAAILPHLLTKRQNVIAGPFWMKGWIGFAMNGVAVGYMVVFIVFYCFPYACE
jgi:choline transport protein